jgi:GntR family transcriptional repressor for pyruvate dehydrogenase complex
MTRLNEGVFRLLTRDIVTGAREPGSRLPREVALAEEFSISRGVTRECIRALEDAGLISVKHGIGATVNPPERWDILHPDVLAALLGSDRRSSTVRQYLECREILEVEAAGLAAQRATRARLRALTTAVADIEDLAARPDLAGTAEAMHTADLAFHQALTSASQNEVLRALVERLHSALFVAHNAGDSWTASSTTAEQYRDILDAIRDGDPETAREKTRFHLEAMAAQLGGTPARGTRARRQRASRSQTSADRT